MNHHRTTAALAALSLSVATLATAAPAAAAPTDDRAYVTSNFDAGVTVVDTTTNTVAATVTDPALTAGDPEGIAVSPHGDKVYVANFDASGTIQILDPANDTITGAVTGFGNRPVDVAFAPDGDTAYAITADTLYEIDTATDSLTANTVSLQPNLIDLAVAPDGATIYASSIADRSVYVVDAATMTLTTAVAIPGGIPLALDVTPDSSDVWVPDLSNSQVHVIDAATNTVTDSIAVTDPGVVALSPDGTLAYVASLSDETIYAISTTTHVVVDQVTDPDIGGLDLQVSGDGATLYNVDAGDELVVLDAATMTVTDKVPVLLGTREVALAPTAPVAPSADIGVDLTATAGPLLASQINYTATATNNGPDPVTAATIQIALPTQTSSVTGLPAGCTYAAVGDLVTCNTGTIANTASKNLTFRANLGLLTIGPLNATATRTASTPNDPNATNDTDTANCTAITSLLISC